MTETAVRLADCRRLQRLEENDPAFLGTVKKSKRSFAEKYAEDAESLG